MFDQEGFVYKKVIVKTKAQKNSAIITFSDGTNYKLANTLVSLFKMRLNSNLINEKAVFITHDSKNIKFISIRNVGALDATIPPLP